MSSTTLQIDNDSDIKCKLHRFGVRVFYDKQRDGMDTLQSQKLSRRKAGSWIQRNA